MIPELKPGQQVQFADSFDHRYWWDVQAGNERYTILTHQARFKPAGELIYTIIDREQGVRGPCNLVGQGYDVKSPGGVDRLLAELGEGTVDMSQRNRVPVNIGQVRGD